METYPSISPGHSIVVSILSSQGLFAEHILFRRFPYEEMSGITRYVPRQIVSNSTFWGFIVYRLVYTPESDALWPAIIAKLNAYVHRSMWQDKGYNFNYDKTSPPSSFDYAVDVPDSMWFQNVVFSDPKFANFSIDGIRNHFIEFLDTTPAPERRGFQQ